MKHLLHPLKFSCCGEIFEISIQVCIMRPMLQAEIAGHAAPELQNNEDYLTSAVFGHLRYLPPHIFWPELFKQATSLSRHSNLSEHLELQGMGLSSYEKLDLLFWPRHPKYGIPDLVLCLTRKNSDALIILIEAKLWANKSGTEEHDQLARYFQLLDDPQEVTPKLPEKFNSVLVYLTPRNAQVELEETVAAYDGPSDIGGRLFAMNWQDILEVCTHAIRESEGNTKLILSDMADFLRRRGLEYFKGFRQLPLPDLRMQPKILHKRATFTHISLPASFAIERGRWVHAR